MFDLFQEISKYEEWTGSRKDLISLIEQIERKDTKKRMLHSKKSPYTALPVNTRRIQWFISQGMMPKPDGQKYTYAHLIFYWATILLRRRDKLQFSQIEGLAHRLDIAEAKNHIFVTDPVQKNKNNEEDTVSLKNRLEKLGRKEGKVLSSRPLKISITPWCQVLINERQLQSISQRDRETLTEAFSLALDDFINTKS